MKDKVLKVVTVLLAIVFLVSAGMLIKYFWGMKQGRDEVNALREKRPQYTHAEAPQDAKAALLEANRKLHEENPDFVGWLTIAGTNVDYPVMYTPTDMEFYLRRTFTKEYNTHGTPFLAQGCDPAADPEPDNLTIFGHHIQTGDMFADLLKYQEMSYWETHKKMQFSTLDEVWDYEIIAIFFAQFDDENVEEFRYDYFVYANNEEEFQNYMQNVQKRQYYTTGIGAEYGDKLITLSTCATSTTEDGSRVVVVAKRVETEEE